MSHRSAGESSEGVRGRPRRSGIAAAATGVLLALAGCPPWPARAAPTADPASLRGTTRVDAAGLESRYGIRINQVAMTGGGGLVDLRFTVVDPDKARPLLGDHASPPRLVAEGGATTLQAPTHGAMRNVRIQKDAACFLLYPNARSAIRQGGRVAVVFGEVEVEPVIVK